MPRRRPAADVERVRRTVSRSLPCPSTSLELRRSLRDYNARARPEFARVAKKLALTTWSSVRGGQARLRGTVADPAVSRAPSRSSRRAPSPSASSSERCARSSCWASCAAGATTIEWSFDHRPGGLRGAGSAVVPGSIERSLAASRRGRRGCDPGSSRGVQGGARRPEPGVPQAGSAGCQTVVTGRQMTARRGVVTGPSEDPVGGSSRPSEEPPRTGVAERPGGSRHPSAAVRDELLKVVAGTVVEGVCRGRPAALRRAHATSAEGLCEGLAGLHRRVVAEPRRCVPRPLRRGRLPRLPMHPKSGPSGRRREVSARAVTGPPSGVAGAV